MFSPQRKFGPEVRLGGCSKLQPFVDVQLGSLEILHCYYAHSEKDDRFQRRCYWMLDE